VQYYRHFPLPQLGHTNAIPAAKASYCSGQQAPKYFWAMHDWLYANQNTWASASDAPDQFRKQAISLGVDGSKYDACVKDPQTDARIQRDVDDGTKMGVQGTPAFFINDWLLAGAYPFSEFQKVIAKAEQGLHPAPTPTPLPPDVQPYDADPNRPGFTYDGSPTLGAAKAPVAVFIFSDFSCPDCVQSAKTIEASLREKYVKPGQVRLIYKFVPITTPKTALAALCAADQGKFWEFYDSLVANQGKWKDGDNAAMSGYAKALGLDTAKFDKCLTDAAGQAQLDADIELAQQVNVTQAPYFLVLNPAQATGLRVPNLVSLEEFEKAIENVQKPQSAAPSASNQPTPAAVAAAKRPEMPVGVDADGNFYRGDPKAPVKLVDFSDFQ
jgi:protein-disulfide isomerase